MIKLYGFPLSGHSHRVELMLNLLNLPFDNILVDLREGEHKTPEFLAKNPFGSVPVLEDGNVTLADSNAIITYLANKYGGENWSSDDAVKAAKIQEWLSIAAGKIAFGPASARLVTVFGASLDHENAKTIANGLFAVMDQTLSETDFLVGDDITIADVANYTYIAHAPEGGVSLDPYPNLRAWLARISGLEGFVPMVETKVGLAA